MKRFIQRFPFSPILIALYAILSLWVTNYDQTPFFSIWRTTFLILLFVALLLLLCRWIFGNWTKAGLVTDVFVVLFVTYGHVYNLLKNMQGADLGRHRILLPIYLVLLAAGIFLVLKLGKRRKAVYQWLNLVSVFMIAVALIRCGIEAGKLGVVNQKPRGEATNTQFASTGVDSPIGDVYYILLDSYGRQDFLQEQFSFDNSEFIKALQERGFVIPDCTQSNYDTTTYSLASALNMKYLEDLGVIVDRPVKDDESIDFYAPIHNSTVRQKFAEYGYQFVTFKTLYPFLDIADSDIYYDVDQYLPFYEKVESLNFQHLFFSTTMLRPVIGIQKPENSKLSFILDPVIRLLNPQANVFKSREYRLYSQYEFALEKLRNLPEIPGKKFVYAHLFLTHSPFIYQANGAIRNSFEDSAQAYRDQITHANEEILKIVDQIIARSEKPPVIILQGDHTYLIMGEQRVEVLNAYYLPLQGSTLITQDITPVNTFRVIFDAYFGADLPLLENHSYYRDMSGETMLREAGGSCVR